MTLFTKFPLVANQYAIFSSVWYLNRALLNTTHSCQRKVNYDIILFTETNIKLFVLFRYVFVVEILDPCVFWPDVPFVDIYIKIYLSEVWGHVSYIKSGVEKQFINIEIESWYTHSKKKKYTLQTDCSLKNEVFFVFFFIMDHVLIKLL